MITGQSGEYGGQGQVRKQRRPKVLIVEDDDRIRELIAMLMRGEGFEVVELCDGMEALNYLAFTEVYAGQRRSPDLIVADINMPTYSGLDLLEGMKEAETRAPVMLVTGEADAEIRAEGRRLGAACVVQKPFDVDRFLYEVEVCMGGRVTVEETVDQ